MANELPVSRRLRVSVNAEPASAAPDAELARWPASRAVDRLQRELGRDRAEDRKASPPRRPQWPIDRHIERSYPDMESVKAAFPAAHHAADMQALQAQRRSCLLLLGRPVKPPVRRPAHVPGACDVSTATVAVRVVQRELDEILDRLTVARRRLLA